MLGSAPERPVACRRRTAWRSADGNSARADDVTGDNDVDTPIFLPPGAGAIGCHRLALPKAGAADGRRRNPLLHEIGPDRLAAALREELVGRLSTDVVGVAFDVQAQAW